MKKWYGGIPMCSLVTLVVLWCMFVENPVRQGYLPRAVSLNSTNPLQWIRTTAPQDLHSTASEDVQSPQAAMQVISAADLTFTLFVPRNMSKQESHTLLTWNHLKNLVNHSIALPGALDATREAAKVWGILMASVHDKRTSANGSSLGRSLEKQCPHYLNKMNATGLSDSSYRLPIPCGLTQGSSITIIGIPNGPLGNFRIDFIGEDIPGEPDPPIISHYNVRVHGDKLTEEPVIIQNTWTSAQDWFEEQRCPSSDSEFQVKVDDLDQCNAMVGQLTNKTFRGSSHINGSSTLLHKSKQYFPFRIGYPFVATLGVGSEGMQMTVDGKHITSFAFRETLDPWLVSEVKVSGDVQLISVLASGLPTSEDLEHVIDLEILKAPPLLEDKLLDLFIGVFSTANNFKRRMAVRRTWMQYPVVRSGAVAVRFFVGLHKNQRVNEQLWDEAQAYGDVQLMPFVDYYSLITWKTLAICTFGANAVSAKYVMKTDDDAFVRVDEILASLNRINATSGLLYGLINYDSQPQRSDDSKWYISYEEWPNEFYPPWAHGPGYVISQDIAKEIFWRQQEGFLKMFKLEDVAMGIWIAQLAKEGLMIRYEKEERIHNEGCVDGYVIAHYQSPQEMLCLWQKLEDSKRAFCC